MASLIRLKQIESSSALEQAGQIGADFTGSVYEIIDGAGLFSSSQQVDLVSASNYDGFVVQLDLTMSSDLEASLISASISQSINILSTTYVTTASLELLSSSIAETDSASAFLVQQLSSSVQVASGEFSASVANQFSSSLANVNNISSSIVSSINTLSSSYETFSSSIGLTIKAKMNADGVISSSAQLDGTTIKNLTLSTDGDAYSLIVSGAVAVVDADITISGSQYNVGGQIFVNGLTGSAGNPPETPYTPTGLPEANVLDNGEW